jgi:two-component system response regulator PilR (NtrC family)
MQHDSTGTNLTSDAPVLEIRSLNSQKFSPVDKYLVGDSEPMRILKRIIEQASSSRSTVLIAGESGTGKELVARAIHGLSKRSNCPFQAINCGAVPETLLEGELFGHLKGSFTGANTNKKGLFAAANGGTVFLDELGEMPLAMQVKLLRVLQERKVRPLGSTEPSEISIDVRVVAATNKNLKQEVMQGHFRQDLFFRLNVFELQLPPLRERTTDIPLLADYLLEKVAKNAELDIPAQLSNDAISSLARHSWPGNVRELENVLERASVVAGNGGTILADHVYAALNNSSLTISHDASNDSTFRNVRHNQDLVRQELELCEQALKSSSGSFSEAARKLNLNRTTFRYRLIRLRTLSTKHE